MKNVLDPLARIPGVRLAALVSSDGVPIDVRTNPPARDSQRRESADAARANGPQTAAKGAADLGAEDLNALSALSSSWIAEVTRAVAPLSWDVPRRLVLRAARGTLIVVQAPRALLLVVLDGGMVPEDLRLPMGVAIARMERHLRALETKSETPRTSADSSGPPGIFPAGKSAPSGADAVHATGNEVPEGSGE